VVRCPGLISSEAGLKNNYILVDYENVQPDNLDILIGHDLSLIVFVGAGQTSVPVALASAMQALGDRARYQIISGNGKNALDFHIAFYMGEIVAGDPDAFFHIIARDSGYDPLIDHLKERRIFARRHESLAAIPFVKVALVTMEDKLDLVVEKLRARGTSRPKKPQTLANMLNAIFCNGLDTEAQEALID
jgi:hypothetical protein